MREDKVKVAQNPTDKVEIRFDVTLPEPVVGTKAMKDEPDVQNLYVAVFGSSGFLKEYVQADVEENQLARKNGKKYSYSVKLTITDSPVKIHFIANGPSVLPFKNEGQVMANLMKNLTDDYPDAYWQRIEIPIGIRAYKNEDGEYLDKNGNVINIDDGKSPVIDPAVEAYFKNTVTESGVTEDKGIALIRNFAKIEVSVKDGVAFTLKKFAVIYKAKSGSVAPYNSRTASFIKNYQNQTYDSLKTKHQYPGNLPVGAEIDLTIPEDETDTDFFVDSDEAIYLYERPVTNENPAMVIIWGTYQGTDYFYRVDLMDGSGYYPIYRNFRYKIEIQDVVRPGSDSPTAAASAAGSGDVSAITDAQNLTDVSDGKARIYVDYTEKTIVGQKTVKLKYKFIPDFLNAPNTTANNPISSTGSLGVYITNKDGSAITDYNGDVIGSAWTVSTADSTGGWRVVTFTTKEPSAELKSQDIKVTGVYNNGNSQLYRIVSYKLMNIKNLEVWCDPIEIPRGKGEKVDVCIKLPNDLPRSLFPLQLKIEADKKSLTPDNDNLPVNPATTIVTGQTSASYQFIKTLSKTEYDALTDKTVRCHFKTSKINSAGENDTDKCMVYVVDKNEEYFNKDDGYFTNYDLHYFHNPSLTPRDASTEGAAVTLKFTMEDYLPEVLITVSGLQKPEGPTLLKLVSEDGDKKTYSYHPTSSSVTIPFVTSNDGGVYSAALKANHYEDAFIANLNYVNPGYTTTSQSRGKDKDVNFSFGYQLDSENNPITEDVTFTLTNLKPAETQAGGTFTQQRSGIWLYHPTSAAQTHNISFKTEKFADTVYVSMSGESYNPAGTFKLNPPTLTVASRALIFTGSNRPDRVYVTIYTKNGNPAGTFYVDRGGYPFNRYYYNNAAFDIDLTKFTDNEEVYFGYISNNNTYYSQSTVTLTQLETATSTLTFTIDKTWNNNRPW